MPEVEWGSRGAEKVFRDNEQIGKSVKSTGDAYKASSNEIVAMGRIAARIAKDNETAQEKYARQLVNAKKVLDSGKISLELFHRETSRATVELLRATDGGNKLTKSVENVAVSSKRAFNLGDLTSFAAGWMTIGRAVSGVTKALADLRAERMASQQALTAGLADFGELQQISATPEEFKKNVGFARRLISEGIVKPEQQGQAATIAFQLSSAGLSDEDKDYFIKLGKSRIVKDLPTMAGAASTFATAVGAEEAGTIRDVVAKSLVAAGPTRARAPEILDAASRFGPSLAALKYSDEEGLAALSLTSRAFGKAPEGATKIEALLGAIDEKGLSKGSLSATVADIQTKELAGESIREVIGGNKEAIAAYRILAKNFE